MTTIVEKSAMQLAHLMKDSGDNDAGNFGHYFIVSDAEWIAICDRAYALLPTVKANPREVAAWAKASRDHRACERAERSA